MRATQGAVETTWSLSRANLTPEARALFEILAFFPAEPISEEVLVQPGRMHSNHDLRPQVPVTGILLIKRR